MKWEYRQEWVGMDLLRNKVYVLKLRGMHFPSLNFEQMETYDMVSEFCNKLGEEGWEVCGFTQIEDNNLQFMILFKRPKE